MSVRRGFILALGALTGWTFLYFVLFILLLASQGALPAPASDSLAPAFATILKLQYSVLLIPLLLIYYLAHLFSTADVPRRRRTIWTFALILASVVVMPIYWYRFLWRASPAAKRGP